MANLTASRSTLSLVTPYDMFGEFPLATGTICFQGSALMFNSAGLLTVTVAGANLGPAGRAEKNGNPLGSLAGDTMKFHMGLHLWAASATNVPVVASRGKKCYFEDNQTVGTLVTAFTYAGIIWDVTSAGVWVLTTPFIGVGL